MSYNMNLIVDRDEEIKLVKIILERNTGESFDIDQVMKLYEKELKNYKSKRDLYLDKYKFVKTVIDDLLELNIIDGSYNSMKIKNDFNL